MGVQSRSQAVAWGVNHGFGRGLDDSVQPESAS